MELPFYKYILFIAISFTVFSTANLGQAADPELKNVCASLTPNQRWAYCVTQTVGSTNHDILYVFPGASENQNFWIKEFPEIRSRWASMGIQAPTVITISFGPVWLLAEKNSSKTSGLFEFTLNTVMPYMEKIWAKPDSHRLLLGLSMGGFNAAQLLLKKGALFQKVALLCPAITTISPYATSDEVSSYEQRTGAASKNVYWNQVMQRSFFPDKASWSTADVLALAPKLLTADSPPLYISCGDKDEWGFFEGSELFAKMALKVNSQSLWDPLIGGHCMKNPTAVADFLVPPQP